MHDGLCNACFMDKQIWLSAGVKKVDVEQELDIKETCLTEAEFNRMMDGQNE